MKCGTTQEDEDGTITFLLTDTQIIDDLFIADVNSLLSSGDVPMLFTPAERDMVSEKMRPIASNNNLEIVSSQDLFEYFRSTIRKRLATFIQQIQVEYESLKNQCRVAQVLLPASCPWTESIPRGSRKSCHIHGRKFPTIHREAVRC